VLRRGFASRILAAAVARMVEKGVDSDWLLLGDLNAELAATNFAPLSKHGLLPLSAEDERNQSVTFLKAPQRSRVDHLYISPNLVPHGAGGVFVPAADKTFPEYLREISDHRPVVTRLSLAKAAPAPEAALPDSLREALTSLYPAGRPPPTGG
jgi:hypothetical protein